MSLAIAGDPVEQHVAGMKSMQGAVLKHWLLVQIHFISASCENMIDGKGMLPGDVLTASNGKTVEVSQLCDCEFLYPKPVTHELNKP
jgi:hypothetical protein